MPKTTPVGPFAPADQIGGEGGKPRVHFSAARRANHAALRGQIVPSAPTTHTVIDGGMTSAGHRKGAAVVIRKHPTA